MPLLIAVMGPTGSGKTPLAEALADRLDAQLINADAFQVYQGLDIGTAKPTAAHRYRLLDLRQPDQSFGVGEWVQLAQTELRRQFEKGKDAVVVGGTGLYIRALFEEYADMAAEPDPALRRQLNELPLPQLQERLRRLSPSEAERVDIKNPVRVKRAIERLLGSKAPIPVKLPPFAKLKLGLTVDVPILEERLSQRARQMVQNGWTLEIQGLRELGYRRDDPGFRAIGYQPLWDYLDGNAGLDEAVATTIADTRLYAKRQRTWLRTEPGLISVPAGPEDDPFLTSMERIEDVLK